MLTVLKHFLLINAYWFSLPLIGFFILSMAQQFVKNDALQTLIQFGKKQHIFISSIICFTVAVALFSGSSLIFYLVQAPAICMTVIYIVFLVGALIYCGLIVSKNLFKDNELDTFRLKNKTLVVKAIFVILLLIITCDFFISTYIGSYALVSADTYVHLSRIESILSQGFTIQSGYFGGLPEAGYHYNVVYALYATASQVTHLQPFEVWRYSFGFFRLLQWLVIFMLAFYIIQNWLKRESYAYLGALLATILAIALYTPYFYTAIYPNQLVGVWLALLVLTLSLYERGMKEMKYCMFILAFITTMTHPTYALMAALFVGLFGAIRFLVERKTFFAEGKTHLITYGASIAILLLGPLRTITFPTRLNNKQIDVGSFAVTKIFGLDVKQPVGLIPNGTINVIILMLSLVGTLYVVIRLWRVKRQLAIALALLLFYPIIVYIPPVFTIFHKVLPLWVLDRFTAMDVLVYILVFVGIYAICEFLVKLGKGHFSNTVSQKIMISMLCILTLVISCRVSVNSYTQLATMRSENTHYYTFMAQTYNDFKGTLKDEKTVLANEGDSYLLGAILPINVLAIEPGHMSPVASADNRIACQNHLLSSFNYDDILASRISFIALSTYSKEYKKQVGIVESKPYLKLVAKDANFSIYKVNSRGQESRGEVYEPCKNYQRIEGIR